MPTYEYECPQCGKFELVQSMKDERLKQCPTCRKKVTRLLGTGAGVIFKGSGFYQTDYRGKDYKAAAKAETETAKPEAKSETKTEAKAEAKPEAKKEAAPAKKEKPE